jgi:hypothetical protein
MKTSDLIGMLATGAGPAPRAAAARRLVPVASGGAALAAMLAIAALGLVPADMFSGTALWTKLVYAALLASASGWLTARLSRPAAPTTVPWCAVAAIVGAMALLGIVSLLAVPAGGRVSHLLGLSWSVCPWFVLALSLPTLVGALWAVRGLAPTRPRQAGLAAGLLAGAVGALGYSWACPEASMTFVAVWYSLGIALTGLIGMALGPHAFRW